MKQDAYFLTVGFVLGLLFMALVTRKAEAPISRRLTSAMPYAGLSQAFASLPHVTNTGPIVIYAESFGTPVTMDNFAPQNNHRTDLIDFRHSF